MKGFSIPQIAEQIGISRQAVYKKVKNGQIPAQKIGRSYVISSASLNRVLGRGTTGHDKKQIAEAVDMAVRQYGPVLKMLAKE